MNKQKISLIALALPLAALGISILGQACKKSKVYIGISDRWHEMADPAKYSQWSYVRSNAAGFYTNFIAMWVNNYQNAEDPQQSCNDMRAAFTNNGCFFETSMETQVNNGANGANNAATDKSSLDQLTMAGFKVDYTSLNYDTDPGRVSTLKTYNGNPDLWTIWTYGELPDEPSFPESAIDSVGNLGPANTMTGIGYWLLHHLKDFPAIRLKATSPVNNNVTLNTTDSAHAEVDISKATDGNREYTIPHSISNSWDPAIEISPVIKAVLSGDQKDWTVIFKINGNDVSDNMVYQGGLNFIGGLRLSFTHQTALTVDIKANSSAASPGPLTIKFVTMSHLTNTQYSRIGYTLVAKAL